MELRSLSSILIQFNGYRNDKRFQLLLTLLIVITGPALDLLTLFYVNIVEQEVR